MKEMQELIEAAEAVSGFFWEAVEKGEAFATNEMLRLKVAISAARKASEGGGLSEILGIGQKFPNEQQRAISLVNQMKELGEHRGKENAAVLYCLDVIVNLLRASEGGWIEPGSCKNCGHSEHGKCMAWAGNGLGWCKCENYKPSPPLSVEKPEVVQK